MIATCPVPTAPAAVILPGGTFVDCGSTWVVQADGSIDKLHALTGAQLASGWRRYCAAVHPRDRRAARVCFTAHVGR